MKYIFTTISLVLFLVVGLFVVHKNDAQADTCVQSLPSVNIFPNNQKGVPGQVLPYVTVVTNNDSAGCGNTTFTVQGQVNSVAGDDSGFTSSATSLTLAPGASGTTNVLITSPNNPNQNTYWVFIYAQDSNSANATHYNLSLALYNIDRNPTDCTRVAPTVSTFPLSATGKAGDTLSYKVAVKNNDSKGCTDSSTFSISSFAHSAGYSSTSSSLTLAPGAVDTTTIKVTSSSSVKNYINNFIVTANDKNLSGHKGSVLATYIVDNSNGDSTSAAATTASCTKKAPTISASSSAKTAIAGSTKPFAIKVKIKNNDSKGCAQSSFAVTTSGLADGAAPINKTIKLAAGASGTVTLSISSATSVPDTTNNLIINVSDKAAGTSHDASTAFSYTATSSSSFSTTNPITPPITTPSTNPNPNTDTTNNTTQNNLTTACTRATPTVSLYSASAATVAAGQPITYYIKVTNNDTGDCTPSTRTFNVNWGTPGGGWNISSATFGMSPIPSGSSDTARATFISSASFANGTYNLSATVSDSTSSVSLPITYVINNSSTCSTPAPTVSVSPSSQTGAAGSTQSYTVTVKNNDSAGCVNSTFNIKANGLGTGFTSNTPSLTLAPGATNTATLTVTSPSNATAGTTSFTILVYDDALNNHSASTTASYIVSGSTACTRAAPTVTLTSMTPASVSAGLPITYYINVTNNDTGNCSPNTRSFTVTMTTPPGGWNGSGTYGMGALASGASATAKETLTSSAGMANGTYNITFNVGDSISSGSLPATYVINNPPSCTTPYPTISMSPTSNTGVAGSTQSYVVTVKNNDASGCVDTTFNISPRGLPSGFTYTSPTLTLAPGATNTATFTVTSPGNATAGTNSFNVVVYDDALNNHSASVGGNYIVSAVGKAKVSTSSLLANVLKAIKKP